MLPSCTGWPYLIHAERDTIAKARYRPEGRSHEVDVYFELELLSETGARLVEQGMIRQLARGDRVRLTREELYLHQGCGRPAPPGLKDAGRRLELDDGAVTWGVGGGHCRAWVEQGVARLEDRGSDNGTYITRGNELRRISGPRGITTVIDGDRITVGHVRFELHAKREIVGAS